MRRKGEMGGDLPGQARGFKVKEDEWMILTADVSTRSELSLVRKVGGIRVELTGLLFGTRVLTKR